MSGTTIKIYTDGSYSKDHPTVTYGAYIVLTEKDGEDKPVVAQRIICENTAIVKSNNAGGELIAAATAIINGLAVLQKLDGNTDMESTEGKVIFYHDYKGIEAFVRTTGKRDCASKVSSRLWVQQYDTLRKQYPKVTFEFKWVKSHSGEKWNTIVDALANGIVALEIRTCLAKDQWFRG